MSEQANHIALRGDVDHLYALAEAVPRWPEFLPHYHSARVLADDGAPPG